MTLLVGQVPSATPLLCLLSVCLSVSCELDLQDDSYVHNVFPLSKLKLASDEQFSNLK
eukprot:SAG11_NODE_23989_length_379_cov_7.125000_1_plen_57_part_01